MSTTTSVRVLGVAAAFASIASAAHALTPTPRPTSIGSCAVTQTCEAELAARGGGVVVSTQHPGYTGSGFADYAGNGTGYVEWTLNSVTPGTHTLTFRYGNGGGTDRPMSISVNGTVVNASLSFPSTSTWTNWTLASINVTLPGGTVRIRATEKPNGPNVDSLRATWVGGTPTPTSTPTATSTATPTSTLPPRPSGCGIGVTCEAENAVRGGGVTVSTLHAGYTGTGFADYGNTGSGYVEWTITVPTGGAYALSFRYANGGTADRPMSITANGVVVSSSLSFPVTGWTSWTVRSVNATLPPGSVRIRATELPNGPNVDSLTVTSVNPTPTPWSTGYMKISVSKVDPKVGEQVTISVTGNTGLGSYGLQVEGDPIFVETPAPSPTSAGTSWSWTLTIARTGSARVRASVYGETMNGCTSCFIWRTVAAASSAVTAVAATAPTPTPAPQAFVSNTIWYTYPGDVLVRADAASSAYAPSWSIKVIDAATGLEQDAANPIVTFKSQGAATPPGSGTLMWWRFTPVRSGIVRFETTVNAEWTCGSGCYGTKAVTATSWGQSVTLP
jgi:hypothetical protein